MSAVRREVLEDGAIRFSDPSCTIVVTRLAAGVVLLSFTGHDTGQFENMPFSELDIDVRRYGFVEVFVDTRDAFNASVGVGDQWADWIQLNKRALKRMSVLVASKFVQLTAETIKLFSRTDLLRVYTDAPAFSDAIAQSLGRTYVLGAQRR